MRDRGGPVNMTNTPHTTPARAFLNANWLLNDSLAHNEYYGAKMWITYCSEALEALRTEASYQDYLMR